MIIENADSRKYTSLRAGGHVKQLYIPNSLAQLSQFLSTNNLPVMALGLGSNLLLRDQGFDGVMIKLSQLNHMSIEDDVVEVEAGTTLAKLARFADSKQLSGAEFLSAIPGNVGGALAMNAGCFGSEMWDLVLEVSTMDRSGQQHQRSKDDFVVAYRQVQSKFTDEIFVSARLKLGREPGLANTKALLEQRNLTQPIGLPSCGSVFKNPPGHYAAKLIEDSGLKGFCIGGACVSEKHANFIINQNQASASEIENLIQHIQSVVKSKFDVELEVELKIV